MEQISSTPTLLQIEIIIKNLFAIIARLAGIVAFIMLLVGGFQILTAAGDPKKAEIGSKTITGAIIGIAIIIGSWFLLLIIKSLTGLDLTTVNFKFNPVP